MKVVIGTIFFVYVLLGMFLFVTQRSQIYFPVPELNLHDDERYEIQSLDIVLKGWVLNPGKPDAIIYFGGNAENVGYNVPQFKELFREYSVYLLNYRGYGGNEGEPTEPGLYADALNVYDKIKSDHDNISIIGRSLGSGVATYLSSVRVVHKLVLITPYDSIRRIAQGVFWMYPMSILLKDKYDSYLCVNEISAETLIIIAGNDGIIPRRSSDNLVAEFDNAEISVRVIKDATHNSVSIHEEFSLALDEFL